MGNREPSFDETGAQDTFFRSGFLWIANKPNEFAPRRAFHGPRHPTAPITRAAFGTTAKQARQDKTKSPARRSILLASAYLVRVTGAPVELGGVPITFIASDSHISYIYIYMPRPYLYLILSATDCTDIWPQLRTRCAGEEAVPSTCCVGGARPCAGRGTVRARSTVPCSDHVKPERTRSVLALAAALGRCSSGARGTTALRAGALGPSVNGLIDTNFGCYPSSKAADDMPRGAPSVGTHAQHTTPC
jgi:hypothetical protein